MADSFILTDGILSFEVVYDSATQANYKLLYGGSIGVPEPAITVHQPDDDHALPARAYNPNRTVFLTMDVRGDDWDDIFNRIAKIKRLVDGANSQALRYWLENRSVNRVTLDILLNGATNTTKVPVLWGFVDDSESFYKPEASINARARGVVIALTVLPWGEGDDITLSNYLQNPAVYVDNGAGLATSWVDVSGTGTPTIDTTNYLVGGRSQKYAATVSGINLATATISETTTSMAGYAWVRVTSGTVTVRLQDTTGATTIDSVTLTNTGGAGSDQNTTDDNGQTWYRAPLSGTVVSGNNHRIEFSTSATANWNTDCIYLTIDTQTVPNGWASFRELENRNDYDNSNPGRIDWIDTWGLPGDVDSYLELSPTITASSGLGQRKFYYGRFYENKWSVTDYPHMQDSTNFGASSATGTGVWSTVVDAARIGGDYERFTGGSGDTGRISPGLPGSGNDRLRIFGSGPVRMFALVKCNQTDATAELVSATGGDLIYVITSPVSVSATGSWQLLDLGLVNATDTYNQNATTPTGPVAPSIKVSTSTAATQFDIDAVFYFPTNEYMLTDSASSLPSGELTHTLAPDIKQVYNPTGGNYWQVLGDMWYAKTGDVATRTFILVETGDVHVLTDTHDVELIVTPRARHLLGTR